MKGTIKILVQKGYPQRVPGEVKYRRLNVGIVFICTVLPVSVREAEK